MCSPTGSWEDAAKLLAKRALEIGIDAKAVNNPSELIA
jgi:hypothetical protein